MAADAERWYLELDERRIELEPGELVIGRDPGADLVLDDATVSRHHAILSVAAERVTLQDLDSSNGSFVNGRRLRGEGDLAAGDRLRLGRIRMALVRGHFEADASTARHFCVSCGAAVPAGSAACPNCGAAQSGDRPLSRSEAVAMSEVMPVGEALAAPSLAMQRTLPAFTAWPAGEAALEDDDTAAAPRPIEETPEAFVEEPPERGEESRPLFLPAARFVVRLAAAAADAVWIGGVALLASIAAGGPQTELGRAVGLGIGLAVWAAVGFVGWSRTGTTPGKRLFGLWVCDLDGVPGIGPRRAAIRLVGCLLSAVTLGLGYLRAGLSVDRRALHDRLAGCYVGKKA
ncbi:MAG TPA: FHA domain-containing protein [Thermoanaerobaculia bacterium]|nr:FHA domain-containing protein [Thermoanaerobaculia bacterium]